MLQKTEMVRRGFVNLRTSCYRSSGGPVLLKKCHGRADFRTGPKVHATLLPVNENRTLNHHPKNNNKVNPKSASKLTGA